MNIYVISEKYISAAIRMGKISRDHRFKGSLKKEVEDLCHQCYLASESIIRDFTDEGIALDNLRNVLKRFNEIALDD